MSEKHEERKYFKMRWDLIEKFEVLKKGRYTRALKSYSGKEDFFRENFPGRPLVPEPLFVEMIAQAGGVLYGLGFDFEKEVILAKIESAKFFKPVPPPCHFVIEATIEEEREDAAWIKGLVRSNGQIVAEAKVLLAAVELLAERQNQKVVFNDHFLKYFDVYNVAKISEGVC